VAREKVVRKGPRLRGPQGAEVFGGAHIYAGRKARKYSAGPAFTRAVTRKRDRWRGRRQIGRCALRASLRRFHPSEQASREPRPSAERKRLRRGCFWPARTRALPGLCGDGAGVVLRGEIGWEEFARGCRDQGTGSRKGQCGRSSRANGYPHSCDETA
jgi:hypothetical protein